MAVDMAVWRQLVVDEVNSIADEDQQRKAWFGVGPWIDSPDEQFCAFFDNASVPEFLARPDNGLNQEQKFQLTRLSELMRHLSDNTPVSIRPEDLIDDPQWVEIRRQAAITLDTLTKKG